MDVDSMARSMTVPQLEEWRAYFSSQPLPWKRMDFSFAMLAMVFRNTMVGLWTKDGRPKPMKDFMLDFSPKKRMTGKEIFEGIKFSFAMSGRLEDKRQ